MAEDFEQEGESIIFRTLADAHPHEMYNAEPERFWAYFQERCPGVSRETMERFLEHELEEAV